MKLKTCYRQAEHTVCLMLCSGQAGMWQTAWTGPCSVAVPTLFFHVWHDQGMPQLCRVELVGPSTLWWFPFWEILHPDNNDWLEYNYSSWCCIVFKININCINCCIDEFGYFWQGNVEATKHIFEEYNQSKNLISYVLLYSLWTNSLTNSKL